ncbi:MAG: hypothetical protein ACYCTZ_03805 [Candidatus Dormibacteria bacterium]
MPPADERPRASAGTAASGSRFELSRAELKQLNSFLDGAIMDSGVRHHLWKGWGLCGRHAWAYSVVEVEAFGGRPFSTTILYEDLLGRAVRSLHRSHHLPWTVALHRLRSSASCFTCDYLRIAAATTPGDPVGKFPRVGRLLLGSQPSWEPAACPRCAQGRGPICRPHLLAGGSPGERAQLEAYLAALDGRLQVFLRSMTWRGPVADDLEKVAWIEALGWFHGWEPAFQLAARA